jgi:hypothetical protein
MPNNITTRLSRLRRENDRNPKSSLSARRFTFNMSEKVGAPPGENETSLALTAGSGRAAWLARRFLDG